MNNSLKNIEDNLRSIAKRYKSIKFTTGLAIAFLMLGVNAFSEEIVANDGLMTRAQIMSMLKEMYPSFNELRAKNNKNISGAKLELIKLMEQGDQVVKSPWASWQFGINYMYNDWSRSYKGRGDKSSKYAYEGIFERSNNIYERTISPKSEHYFELKKENNKFSASGNLRNNIGSSYGILKTNYGLASLKEVREPFASFDVVASIQPKSIKKGVVEVKEKEPIVPEQPKAVSFKEPVISVNPEQAPKIKVTSPTISSPTPQNPMVNIPTLPKAVDFEMPEVKVLTKAAPEIIEKEVTVEEITVASKTPITPILPGAIDFNPVTPNVKIPKDPALPEPPTFAVVLGADCNVGCDSGNSSNGGIRSKRKSNFNLNGRAQGSIQSILHYTWFNNTSNESGYAFKMYTDTGSNFTLGSNKPHSTNGLNTFAGKEVFFDSYNFRDEFEKTIANSQGVERNHQYFFIGGSRFIESDNARTNTIKIPQGYTLNLGGILTLGLVSQGHNTTQLNEGLITDKKEKDDKWIKDMPTDVGKDYLTIHGPGSDYQIKRSADGYVGYKVGIALVQEDNVKGGKILNTGEIDFRGERSIGLYTYLPTYISNREMINEGKINLSGEESYGIKLAAKTSGNASMLNNTNGEINLRKNPDGVDKADNSTAMALMEDPSVSGGVNLAKGKAVNEGKINLTEVENSLGMYVNIDSDMTNKGTIEINSEINKVTLGEKQAVNIAMRADKNSGAEIINASSGKIKLDGSYAIGMLAKGAKLKNEGAIATEKEVSNTTAIAGIDSANVEINNGIIKLTAGADGKENIGIFLKNGSTARGTSRKIEVSGNKSTGILVTKGGASTNASTLNLTMNEKIKVDGNAVVGVIADESTVTLDGNAEIELNNKGNVSQPVDENGSYGVLVKGSTGSFMGKNTNVTAKVATNKSAGLYSEGNLVVKNANITTEEGAINFFAKDAGTIELKGQSSTSETGQKSLLFYTDGENAKVKISGKMTATIKGGTNENDINGRGTAFLYKHSGSTYGTFDEIGIQNWAKKNFGDGNTSTLNNLMLTMEDNSRLFVARNVEMNLSNTDGQNLKNALGINNITGSKYKTFMLYDSKLNIDRENGASELNLDNSSNSLKKIEISSSSITNKIKISGTNENQIVIAQENKHKTDKSRVSLVNDGEITLSGDKSTAIYGKFAKIENKANKNIKVGASSTGIYALNNTEVNNKGKIKVGKNSTGVFYSDIDKGKVLDTTTSLTNAGEISLAGDGAVGMVYEAGNITSASPAPEFKNTEKILGEAKKENLVGMYAKKAKTGNYEAINSGSITLGDANSSTEANIGIYTDSDSIGSPKLKNTGTITAGNNSIGMYGNNLENTKNITVGNSGIAMYSKSGNVDIKGNSKVIIGNSNAVAVYTAGSGQTITSEANSNITIGENSYAFMNKGSNNTLDLKGTTKLGENSTLIYNENATGTTTVSSIGNLEGKNAIGIYSKGGILKNSGEIDFTTNTDGNGVGNIAIYGTNNANITNTGAIKLGTSTERNRSMALVADSGTITNSGAIEVGSSTINGEHGIVLYTKGTGTIDNSADITTRGNNTIGAFASENSKINLNGGSITNKGKNTTGYYLDTEDSTSSNPNESIIASGTNINVDGENSTGIFVNKGTLDYKGTTTVNGSDKAVYGIVTNTDKAKIKGTGTLKVTGGAGAVAVVAKGGSTTEGLDVTATLSEKSTGLYSEGNSNLGVSNANIETDKGGVNFYAKGGTITVGGGNSTVGEGSLLLNIEDNGVNKGKINFTGATTAIIKGNTDPSKAGTAFLYKGKGATSSDYGELSANKIGEWAKEKFGKGGASTLNYLTLNMENNSRLFVASNVEMNLSNTDSGNLATNLGGLNLRGNNYKTFMLYDSKLNIDNAVDLDDTNNLLEKLEISSSSITNTNKITGTAKTAIAQENKTKNKDRVTLINENLIDLKGANSTAIYGKFGKINNNSGASIKVENNSTGIYALNNTEVSNEGKITVGANSTGIFYSDVLSGIGAKNYTTTTKLNNAGEISLAGDQAVGMIYEAGDIVSSTTLKFENKGNILGKSNKNLVGMFAKKAKNGNYYDTENRGTIELGDANSNTEANIAMYTDATTAGKTKLKNTGAIIVGNYGIGMYGAELENNKNITVGNKGVAMHSKAETVDIGVNSNIIVGNNNAVAVYTEKNNQKVTSKAGAKYTIGNKSYGFVNKANNAKLNLDGNASLGGEATFITNEAAGANIANKIVIIGTGNKNLAIYAKGGTVTNNGNIDFSSGQANKGIYATNSANITNKGEIKLASSIDKDNRSIALIADAATIINESTGVVTVNGEHGIGLYSKGTGKIDNSANITTTGDNVIGAFASDTSNINLLAGTIKTEGNKTKGYYLDGGTSSTIDSGAKVEVVGNNSTGIFINSGTLDYKGKTIVKGDGVYGIVANTGKVNASGDNLLKLEGTATTNGSVAVVTKENSTIKGLNVEAKVSGDKSLGLYSAGDLKVAKADIKTENGAVNFFADNNGTISIASGNIEAGTGADRGSLLFYTKGNGEINFTGDTTATVKGNTDPTKAATAFYYEGSGTLGQLNTYTDLNPSNFATWAKNKFGDRTNSTLNHLTLNMEDDSRLLIAGKVKMNLSSTSVSNLFNELANKPTIVGDKYKTFMLSQSHLNVDQNVNLDNTADAYNKLEISSSSITNNKEITGTKDGQVAIAQKNDTNTKSAVTLVNNGKINLTGKNSTAIYGNNAIIKNETNGEISVGEDSTAIYGLNNTEISNKGKLNLASNSVGLFYSDILKDKVSGAETVYDTKTGLKNEATINLLGSNSTAMIYEAGNIGTNTVKFENSSGAKIIGITGNSNIGMYAKVSRDNKKYNTINDGIIELGDSESLNNSNIAMYTNATATGTNSLENKKDIKVGNNSIGMYGFEETNSGNIIVGDAGIAMYSKGGDVSLSSGKITTGAKEAVGVYTVGSTQNITNSGTSFDLGESSFGFVNVGTGNTINSTVNNVNLKKDSIYVYSNDTSGTVTNSTNLTSTGDENYGIYSAGTVTNSGTIDFSNGIGNVGIYSIKGGKATNSGTITVGASDIETERFGIAMAAGYQKEDVGYIKNTGTLNVNGKGSIGMYATSKGSVAENTGNIILNANKTTGIFLDNGAKGINRGTIKTGKAGLSQVVGVYLGNGSELDNQGTIELDATEAKGVFITGGSTIKNYGTMKITGKSSQKVFEPTADTGKEIAGIEINTDGLKTKIIRDKKEIKNLKIVEQIDMKGAAKDIAASSIGMYIDTSRKNYTKPIEGVEKLIDKVDLIIGNEATLLTTSKDIIIRDPKIIEPYKKAQVTAGNNIKSWDAYSGALTWLASAKLDKNNLLKEIAMSKIPYTEFAGKKYSSPVAKDDTFNFLDGLEQRYGVEKLNTPENKLYQKLNSIGKNEEVLLHQAVDEMMGHQYANVQQRLHQTGEVLDKEFNYLKKEWETKSKDSNKVKAFGMNGEYKTDSAGIIDYKNHAQGFAYLHENETIKLGATTGWYGGFIQNHFKFDDIGKSSEKMYQAKLGIFKSYPFDHNNSLNWTVSGETFVGYNRMNRKFLVVDEIFEGKSKYWSYGLGINNELSKTFRLSEDISVKPYGGLKVEYGRFQKIEEKAGEVRLEVKANDYYSIKPELGVDFGYKHHLSNNKTLTASLGLSYENELGQVADTKNKARVAYTKADWFNIRGEKEDRRGNLKTDLNIGLENERYGVTANVGYDTKGNNVRGGLGLRIIF